jgi:hypothetical protein
MWKVFQILVQAFILSMSPQTTLSLACTCVIVLAPSPTASDFVVDAALAWLTVIATAPLDVTLGTYNDSLGKRICDTSIWLPMNMLARFRDRETLTYSISSRERFAALVGVFMRPGFCSSFGRTTPPFFVAPPGNIETEGRGVKRAFGACDMYEGTSGSPANGDLSLMSCEPCPVPAPLMPPS